MIKGKQIDDPLTLTEALAWSYIGPGDAIYLRGGTYAGDFTCSLVGTADAPIVIRPYPGEAAVIDGVFQITGQYCHFVDIEFTFTGWGTVADRGSVSYEVSSSLGFGLSGIGNRAIGCRIHDNSGSGSWQSNKDGGYFDSMIYNVGALYTDGTPHGHCCYTQNEFPTQYHHNNIMWGAYNFGIHAYTQNGLLYYFDVQRNISFRNGGRNFAAGGLGGQRCSSFYARENCTYPGGGDYYKGNNGDFDDDYWGGVSLGLYNGPMTGNSFGDDLTNIDGVPHYDEPTSGKVIRVYPREYQIYFPGWAHIAIYNWDQDAAVDVDLSGVTGLDAGDTCILHNAQDYDNDTVTLIVPESKIVSVDMRAASHSVVGRIGSDLTVETTFPKFGAFVLERL